MIKLYIFCPDKLEFVQLDLRPLWLLIPVILLSFGFRYLFFEAAIIKDTDWQGKEIKMTIEQYLTEQQRINSYAKRAIQ